MGHRRLCSLYCLSRSNCTTTDSLSDYPAFVSSEILGKMSWNTSRRLFSNRASDSTIGFASSLRLSTHELEFAQCFLSPNFDRVNKIRKILRDILKGHVNVASVVRDVLNCQSVLMQLFVSHNYTILIGGQAQSRTNSTFSLVSWVIH